MSNDINQRLGRLERAVDPRGIVCALDTPINRQLVADGLRPLDALPTRAFDSAIELNLRGPYLCTREAGRHMIEQHSGAIVNVSSGAGVGGVKGGAHYASAKAGLQMFTRVTAAEWGRYGIRANCVAVGLVAFLALMLVAQGALFIWTSDRIAGSMPATSPRRLAILVASDLSAALDTDPAIDIDQYVKDQYSNVFQPFIVLMRDGREVANHPAGIPDDVRNALRVEMARGELPARGRVFVPRRRTQDDRPDRLH